MLIEIFLAVLTSIRYNCECGRGNTEKETRQSDKSHRYGKGTRRTRAVDGSFESFLLQDNSNVIRPAWYDLSLGTHVLSFKVGSGRAIKERIIGAASLPYMLWRGEMVFKVYMRTSIHKVAL